VQQAAPNEPGLRADLEEKRKKAAKRI
jgi:hypothetical protein